MKDFLGYVVGKPFALSRRFFPDGKCSILGMTEETEVCPPCLQTVADFHREFFLARVTFELQARNCVSYSPTEELAVATSAEFCPGVYGGCLQL